MPPLIRLYITQTMVGFVLSVVFVAMLLAFDVAGLRHLILNSSEGWLALILLLIANTTVFAAAQFGIAVMRLAEDDEPRKGRMQPVHLPTPALVRVDRRRR
ncbi:hypothetical protein [Halodurantibacterium flavum]|uniref:Uncharacterized protein n=1 Tax=Halodurantibacterium flavum TaxID=1382802 RepID=A0ABW4S8C9_9RHOB